MRERKKIYKERISKMLGSQEIEGHPIQVTIVRFRISLFVLTIETNVSITDTT